MKKFKYGDVIRNGWAGGSNPCRVSIYLNTNGQYVNVLTNDDGALHKTRFYKSDVYKDDGRFEVIGHSVLLNELKTELYEYLQKEVNRD